MAEKFLHGVEVYEIKGGQRTIRTTKVIGLIGTASVQMILFFH